MVRFLWHIHQLILCAEYSQRVVGTQPTINMRNSEKFKNIRKFYENLAKKLGKEPLVPETWYSIPRQLVATQQVYLNKLALF